MYKKSIALRAGEYRMTPVEDYDYWLRLTEHCEIKYVPIELMDYRLRSTYSMSRKLRTSPFVYRRKRYISQLIRLEARKRRNIPVETTIIVLWKHASRLAIRRLEKLFEQTYYNFNCTIIDQSPNASFIGVLKKIPDPRVSHLHMPGVSDDEAIRTVVSQLQSPFVMIYGNGRPITKHFLANLIQPFRTKYLNLLSIHHAEERLHPLYRSHAQIDPHYQALRTPGYTLICRSVPIANEPHLFHLYHAPKLFGALNS